MPDAIAIRTVDEFEEPAFSERVSRLLHDPDRKEISLRLFGSGQTPPQPTHAQQVRVGAFIGESLIGWSHAFLLPGGVLYVSNSAVEPAHRRQGVYTRLMAAMEAQARVLRCLRIESHHRTSNNAVLIAKLKAGYVIVGTEFTAEMGLLVKMSKQLDPVRGDLFNVRAGVLEGAARFFRTAS